MGCNCNSFRRMIDARFAKSESKPEKAAEKKLKAKSKKKNDESNG